jgi:hypothetical protein
MDHNLIIEGEDFRLEVESTDFEFIAAIQAFIAEMITEEEVEDDDFIWEDDEEEEETEEE